MPTSDSILTSDPDIIRISVREETVTPDAPAGVLVVGVVGKEDELKVVAPGLPDAVASELTTTATVLKAGSKVGTLTTAPAPVGAGADTVILVGLGKDADSEITDEVLRRAAGSAARATRGKGTAVFALDPARPEAVATGAGLGAYQPKKVTGKDEAPDVEDALVVVSSEADFDAVRVNAVVRERLT